MSDLLLCAEVFETSEEGSRTPIHRSPCKATSSAPETSYTPVRQLTPVKSPFKARTFIKQKTPEQRAKQNRNPVVVVVWDLDQTLIYSADLTTLLRLAESGNRDAHVDCWMLYEFTRHGQVTLNGPTENTTFAGRPLVVDGHEWRVVRLPFPSKPWLVDSVTACPGLQGRYAAIVRVRPGWEDEEGMRELLEGAKASSDVDLQVHVVTAGIKPYALMICSLLGMLGAPGQEALIKHEEWPTRIHAREDLSDDDSSPFGYRKDLDVTVGELEWDQLIIYDDTCSIWREQDQSCLTTVPRFMWYQEPSPLALGDDSDSAAVPLLATDFPVRDAGMELMKDKLPAVLKLTHVKCA